MKGRIKEVRKCIPRGERDYDKSCKISKRVYKKEDGLMGNTPLGEFFFSISVRLYLVHTKKTNVLDEVQ